MIRTPTMTEGDILEALAYSEGVFGASWTPELALREFREEERIAADREGAWRKRLRGYRRNYLALDARAVPYSQALEEVREPLARWLAENPFASVDVLLEPEAPLDLAPLEKLVEAIQAPECTLGAPVHRRVWTLVGPERRARLGEEWLARARRLSLLDD